MWKVYRIATLALLPQMTGYNEERWAFVNTPYSFISAASTFNLTTGRGLISGAVR
jgi:hypothetical protein